MPRNKYTTKDSSGRIAQPSFELFTRLVDRSWLFPFLHLRSILLRLGRLGHGVSNPGNSAALSPSGYVSTNGTNPLPGTANFSAFTLTLTGTDVAV